MRFKREETPHPGKSRTVIKFLWWPKSIDTETRWLEWATWIEVYSDNYAAGGWEATQWSS